MKDQVVLFRLLGVSLLWGFIAEYTSLSCLIMDDKHFIVLFTTFLIARLLTKDKIEREKRQEKTKDKPLLISGSNASQKLSTSSIAGQVNPTARLTFK